MVCSICKGSCGAPNHNARTCPKLEVGGAQVAEAVVTGAGEAAAVGALTVACPPAGVVVGGVLLAKKAYDLAVHAYGASRGKTEAERKFHVKKAVVDFLADNVE